MAPAAYRQLPASSSRTRPIRVMIANPTGSAAARQASEICMAGVVTGISSTANSQAEGRIMRRKARAATVATTSSANRLGGDSMPTNAVMRMCSARCSAIADPNIASQRNSVDASSSDQMIGL